MNGKIPDLTIREAQNKDAEFVFTLLTELVTSYQPDRVAFDRHYPSLISSGQSVFLVAADGSDVVGYILGTLALTLYANGYVLEIQGLTVAPERRGCGIGRRLVEATLERARAAGCAEATVPTRRAGDFYTGLGFEETAICLKRRLTQQLSTYATQGFADEER